MLNIYDETRAKRLLLDQKGKRIDMHIGRDIHSHMLEEKISQIA